MAFFGLRFDPIADLIEDPKGDAGPPDSGCSPRIGCCRCPLPVKTGFRKLNM